MLRLLLANSFGVETFSLQVTIGMLSDDIILKIFRCRLDATPQFWPTFTSVCQRWRDIIFTSPLGLNLRLYCRHKTPVLTTLDCWPPLPIVVQYGGVPNLDPPAPEDDDNIIAALKQSDRVSSISLTITSSLLQKLSAISEPFSELEELILLSQDNTKPNLPATFRWGPRLRTLHSTGISLPSFPQLLSLSHDLVDLQLCEIPRAGYFPAHALAGALSGMSQLETISLHFLSPLPSRNYRRLLPMGDRVVLPSLTCLKYRGTSKYLDIFVARIDAPRLGRGDIDIRFFNQPTIDASELGRFFERIEMPFSRADVETSAHTISISFFNSNTSHLRLQISCQELDWQLSCMIQVCDRLSPFLFRVQNLRIDAIPSSSMQDSVGGEQWLEFVRLFSGAGDLWVTGVSSEPVKDILCALSQTDGNPTTGTVVLPVLRNLHVCGIMSIDKPFWNAARSSITSRRSSSHPLTLLVLCYKCNTISTRKQASEHFQRSKQEFPVMCSHCELEADAGTLAGTRSIVFPKHPEDELPEV